MAMKPAGRRSHCGDTRLSATLSEWPPELADRQRAFPKASSSHSAEPSAPAWYPQPDPRLVGRFPQHHVRGQLVYRQAVRCVEQPVLQPHNAGTSR